MYIECQFSVDFSLQRLTKCSRHLMNCKYVEFLVDLIRKKFDLNKISTRWATNPRGREFALLKLLPLSTTNFNI